MSNQDYEIGKTYLFTRFWINDGTYTTPSSLLPNIDQFEGFDIKKLKCVEKKEAPIGKSEKTTTGFIFKDETAKETFAELYACQYPIAQPTYEDTSEERRVRLFVPDDTIVNLPDEIIEEILEDRKNPFTDAFKLLASIYSQITTPNDLPNDVKANLSILHDSLRSEIEKTIQEPVKFVQTHEILPDGSLYVSKTSYVALPESTKTDQRIRTFRDNPKVLESVGMIHDVAKRIRFTE